MMYAIVALIIITSFSLLFLSYFSINYRLVDKAKRTQLSEHYAMQGLALLNNADIRFETPYTFDFDNTYHVKAGKRKWGGYHLFISVVLSNAQDTLACKVAFAGQAKNVNDSTALLLFKNGRALTIGANAIVNGRCYVPEATILQGRGYNNAEDITRLYRSPDSMAINNADTAIHMLASWLDRITDKNVYLDDSLSQSFLADTRYVCGDSIFINGKLSGNIIVCANRVEIAATAIIKDAIIAACSIRIADSFSGTAQLWATDSIITGHHCRFLYPSLLAVMPDAAEDPVQSPGIFMGDSVTVQGTVYACGNSSGAGKYAVIKTGSACTILGGMYATGAVQWQGTCKGSIITKSITDNAAIQENLLNNMTIDIDALPAYFTFDVMYPTGAKKMRIAKWLEKRKP